MVGLPALRESVQYAKEHFKLIERKACKFLSVERSFVRYKKRPDKNIEVKERINHWVEKRPRYGQPRIHEMLLRNGFLINHKRTEKLYYKDLKLSLKAKNKKKRFRSVVRSTIPKPSSPNDVWSMDFIFDQLSFGKRVKGLTMVDVFSKINHALEFDYGLNGFRVIQILENVCDFEGASQGHNRVDNGPEFICLSLDEWASQKGIKLRFSKPGKPTDDAFIESFNGKVRDEFLNMNWFSNLEDLKVKAQTWSEE